MFAIAAVLAMLVPAPLPAPSSDWTPTNDAFVNYQWTVEPGWRPACELRVKDVFLDNKHVSIHYRNRSGARIALTLRMNPTDPHSRIIPGCAAIETLEVSRR